MYGIKRRGFAMILAIFVVVLVAAGGAVLMSNASISGKSVSDNYLRAQADLLSESATEFAVMRAQGFNTAGGNCLENLDITVNDATGIGMFDVNVTISYSFRGAAPGAAPGACTNVLAENTLKETTMLIDTAVTDHNLGTEPIRIHKRTWQKL